MLAAPPVLDPATMFAGGRLCLDFINTLCERRGEVWEFLRSPEALREWLRSAGLRDEPCDEKVFARAIELRSALRALVMSAIQREEAPAKALEVLNAVLRANPSAPQVVYEGGSFRESSGATNWLTEIARDAVDLLCHSDLSLLRQCECETCVRVFYDSTKNHKRRWCVEKCGSRVKSAAYYQRKRAKTHS